MKTESRWFNRLAMMAAFAAAIPGAVAQDPPPATPPADPPAEEPEAPPAKLNWISYGINAKWPTGNARGARKYGMEASQFSIQELRVLNPAIGTSPFTRFTHRGSPWDDTATNGLYIFDRGRASLRGDYIKTDFFEHTVNPVQRSRDRRSELTGTYALTPKIGAFVTYEARDFRNYLEAPHDPTLMRTKSVGGGVSGQMLGGNAAVTWVDRRYYDRTGTQPDSVQRQFHAQYLLPLGPRLSVEGAYSAANIGLIGSPDSQIDGWSLAADWDMGPDTTLSFDTRKTEYDLPTVESAYVREQFLSHVRLIHHFAGVSFQMGYAHKENERVRASQDFVDVPKWDTYDARLTTRLKNGLRLSLRGSVEHLLDGPTMLTDDNRPLYWDDRIRATFKVDGGNDRFSGYASYSYRFDQNSPRDTEVVSHNFTIGTNHVINEKLGGYFEVAYDSFEAKGPTEDGISLDDYFPSSVSIAAGLDLAIRPSESFSLGISHYFTRNANPLQLSEGNYRGTEVTASYRRQFSPNHSLDLTYAPWSYTDRITSQLGYRLTVLGVHYTVKF